VGNLRVGVPYTALGRISFAILQAAEWRQIHFPFGSLPELPHATIVIVARTYLGKTRLISTCSMAGIQRCAGKLLAFGGPAVSAYTLPLSQVVALVGERANRAAQVREFSGERS
jgi:hypothetical protein